MSTKKATVLIPTTGNRGPLLPYSVGSVQNQTIRDLDIFIIGDGVTVETRKMIHKMKDEDPRIRFFDNPKHERRGEPYRHQALQEADSEIVCYLCDRDVMLPHHVETMYGLLNDYNFASTVYFDVKANQKVFISQYISYYGKASDHIEKARDGLISLSNAGHTLDFYRKLPYGWRTTPKNRYTDVYMWQQFNTHPDCKAFSLAEPTILYFKRGDFPGASVEQRKRDLEIWSKRVRTEEGIEQVRNQALGSLIMEHRRFKQFTFKIYSNPIAIWGHTPMEAYEKLIEKISNFFNR